MGGTRVVAALALITLTGFVTTLDNTVANVALPTLQRAFALNARQLEQVGVGYVLSFGALLLLGGRLADLYGRRPMLAWGHALFTASSALAGLAGTATLLTAARTAQGAGAALLVPAALSVVATDLPPRQRALGVGLWTTALAVALALGPLTGGLVTEHWGWRWVFWLNVPFGALALVLVRMLPAGVRPGTDAESGSESGPGARVAPGPRGKPAGERTAETVVAGRVLGARPAGRGAGAARTEIRGAGLLAPGPAAAYGPARSVTEVLQAAGRGRFARLDLPGAVLSATAVYALTYALLRAGEAGAGDPAVRLWLLVAVPAGAAYALAERRARHPLVDGRLLRDRRFRGGTAAQTLWGVGVNGVFFFTALHLQTTLGFSPAKAGLAFLPLALALMAVTPFAERLSAAFGAHRVIATGLLLVAAGLLVLSAQGRHATYLSLQPGLLLIGAGSGLTTPLTLHSLAGVPASATGMASGVTGAAREISGALGIALVGLTLTAHRRAALHHGAAPPSAFLAGYRAGLHLGALCVALASVIVAAAFRPAPRHRRPRKP